MHNKKLKLFILLTLGAMIYGVALAFSGCGSSTAATSSVSLVMKTI